MVKLFVKDKYIAISTCYINLISSKYSVILVSFSYSFFPLPGAFLDQIY